MFKNWKKTQLFTGIFLAPTNSATTPNMNSHHRREREEGAASFGDCCVLGGSANRKDSTLIR
jgi:hypothetical protein